MCGTRGRGTRGEKISMVGGKTNDDIFATNVRPKEKKKQVKQKKKKKKKEKKHTCSSIFDQPGCLQSRRGEDSESTTRTRRTHKRNDWRGGGETI